jgi:hypothetical protein
MAGEAEILKGVNDFTEQPREKRLENGVVKDVRRWLGPQAKLDDYVSYIVSTLEPDRVRYIDGVPAEIEAEFGETQDAPYADPVSTVEDAGTWELIGSDLEKPLATHGYYNLSGATVALIEAIDEAIRKGIARDTDWDTLYPNFNMQSYCNHRLRGIDTYVSFSYVIRKEVIFNSKVPLQVEFSSNPRDNPNIPGKVIPWTSIGVPASAKFQKPKIHVFDRLWVDKEVNEWLVKAPTLRWAKGKREWHFTREWWGAEAWSQALYEGGSYIPT